ncbi:SRPBCC domain-containing protein [bacterium]|nr:SRPBCC domain-containing protein [bacterium]
MTLTISQNFQCSSEFLWRSWTDSDWFNGWFFPKPLWTCKASIDFRDGGQLLIDLANDDGLVHTFSGVYLEILPQRFISFTWRSPIIEQSIVSVSFDESPGGCQLTLTHVGMSSSDVIQFNIAGWEGVLDQLTWFVSSHQKANDLMS